MVHESSNLVIVDSNNKPSCIAVATQWNDLLDREFNVNDKSFSFRVPFKNPVIIDQDQVIEVCLSKFEFTNRLYTVVEGQNQFKFGPAAGPLTTITLPPGFVNNFQNYDTGVIQPRLQAVMPGTTFTYDIDTGKNTLNQAAAWKLEFDENSPYLFLGGVYGEISGTGAVQLPNCVDTYNGLNKLYIKSNFGQTQNNVQQGLGFRNRLLCAVPLSDQGTENSDGRYNMPFGSRCTYQRQASDDGMVFIQGYSEINYLELEVVDWKNRYVNFNGCPWSATICFKYHSLLNHHNKTKR